MIKREIIVKNQTSKFLFRVDPPTITKYCQTTLMILVLHDKQAEGGFPLNEYIVTCPACPVNALLQLLVVTSVRVALVFPALIV